MEDVDNAKEVMWLWGGKDMSGSKERIVNRDININL